MVYFSLILGNENNSRENELLCSSIKHSCVPRIGENIIYDNHKFKVIRIIYDFNDVEKRKTLVVVSPVKLSEPQNISSLPQPKVEEPKTNSYFDFDISTLLI